ncbi:MAG: winged helix-turn-helix transcriptional regulator [Thermoplasmata archaeon]
MAESALTSRERILALVEAEPGLHLRELPRRLGLSLRSVRYHLEVLARQELVTPHRSGRFERWFLSRVFPQPDRAIISALRVRGQRAILQHLLRHGPTRSAALQATIEGSTVSVTRWLANLVDQGLVIVGADRQYRLRDPRALAVRLSEYRDRFPELLADAAREIFDEEP